MSANNYRQRSINLTSLDTLLIRIFSLTEDVVFPIALLYPGIIEAVAFVCNNSMLGGDLTFEFAIDGIPVGNSTLTLPVATPANTIVSKITTTPHYFGTNSLLQITQTSSNVNTGDGFLTIYFKD